MKGPIGRTIYSVVGFAWGAGLVAFAEVDVNVPPVFAYVVVSITTGFAAFTHAMLVEGG